jgi:hypothetical protein
MNPTSPTQAVAGRDLTRIVAIYLIPGPILGALLFVPARAMMAWIVEDAAVGWGLSLFGILMLPAFIVVGLPVGFACGVVAAWETRRRGRPGWRWPLLVAGAAAVIIGSRAGGGFPEWIALVVSHVGSAAVCTKLARQVGKEAWIAGPWRNDTLPRN